MKLLGLHTNEIMDFLADLEIYDDLLSCCLANFKYLNGC